MRFCALQSGSNGNSIFVEADGVRLLFDAGISGKQAQLRLMDRTGIDIRQVQAVLISHDHRDHVMCAGIYHRKFGLPVHATEPTYRASLRHKLGPIAEVTHHAAGQTLTFGPVTVETIPTPHDAEDGCGFVVEAEGRRLGILTDLGHAFDGLADLLATLDAVLIESNYDPDMLASGWYPWRLKRRITGPAGHLSNEEAGELLATAGGKLQWACIGHLSQDNNTPELALETVRDAVGGKFPIHLAGRHAASDVLEV